MADLLVEDGASCFKGRGRYVWRKWTSIGPSTKLTSLRLDRARGKFIALDEEGNLLGTDLSV